MASALNIYNWQILPDRVAVHFGNGGEPNGWAGKDSNFFITQGLYVFMFLMFYGSPFLISKIPSRWVNIPNRDYWLNPENRNITQTKMTTFMSEMGIYILLFFIYIGQLTVQANLNPSVRLDESEFCIALWIFCILIIYWMVKFLLAFRKPSNA